MDIEPAQPGTRVPTIIISPYAKRGYVDHTRYDTTAILKFSEDRWGLAPLGTRDAAAGDLTNAFDFAATPGLPHTGAGGARPPQPWWPFAALTALGLGLARLRPRRER